MPANARPIAAYSHSALRISRRSLLALPTACIAAASLEPARPTTTTSGNVLDFIPPHLHVAIHGDRATGDLSAYYRAAFERHRTVHFPAGTYWHRSFAIPAGSTLATDGFETVFRQLPDVAPFLSLFVIEGAGTRMESCTLHGIIGRFDHRDRERGGSSEFNHMILVHGRRGMAPLDGVEIGDIVARNVRGDGITLLCDRGAILRNVRIGAFFGHNVLRNGIAIVGGADIEIDRIDGSAFGYATFDIEPESDYSAPVERIRVGHVRGATVQISADPDSYVRDVVIDSLDTDPSHARSSQPVYRNRRGTVMLDSSTGLRLRNADAIRIGSHRARGHVDHAIGYIGDPAPAFIRDPSIEIGTIDYAGIGRNEAIHLALIQAVAMRDVAIRGGQATMANDRQRLILGGTHGAGTRCQIDGVTTDGMIAAYVTRSRFSGVTTNASGGRGFAVGVTRSEFQQCKIVASYLGYNLTDCTFTDCSFTATRAGMAVQGGSAQRNRFVRSTITGRRIADGPLPLS